MHTEENNQTREKLVEELRKQLEGLKLRHKEEAEEVIKNLDIPMQTIQELARKHAKEEQELTDRIAMTQMDEEEGKEGEKP